MPTQPTSAAAPTTTPGRTTAAMNNLLYFGGPVMQAANNSVPIFWLPATLQDGRNAPADPNYTAFVQRYFQDVGGSGLYDVNTQYFQTTNGFTEYIVNASGLLTAVVDTSPYPAAGPGCLGAGVNCIDDQQVRDEITKVVTAQSLPTDTNTTYYVFTAPHESSCVRANDCFKSDIGASPSSGFTFCAYHSFTTVNGQFAIYANMPYGATAYNNGCTSLSAFPNNRDADIVISTTSHEQMEATTNPFLIAWFDANGQENADKCAYVYGALPYANGKANQFWHGNPYVVQQEWSNAISGCTSGAQTTVPTGPNGLTSVAGDKWLSFTFGAPADDGGSPITGYQITVAPIGLQFILPPSTRRALVENLTNGTAYTVKVAAINAQGTGPLTVGQPAAPSVTARTFMTNWNDAEYARLVLTANFLGTTPQTAQLSSVYALAYLVGIVNSAGTTPLAPPVSAGPHSVATTYSAADQIPLVTVMRQYGLTPSESQYFASQLVGYLLALGGH